MFFIVNSSFSGSISNISLNRIRGQYIGKERVKADADLYKAATWGTYTDIVETFPSGTAARFTRPSSGGSDSGGFTQLGQGGGTDALIENLESSELKKNEVQT